MKTFDHAFEAGGKPYTMRYNFNARRKFERQHKMTVSSLLLKLADKETHTAELLVAAYAMLLSECQPNLSEDDVAAIINVLGEDEAVTVLAAAIESGSDTANP